MGSASACTPLQSNHNTDQEQHTTPPQAPFVTFKKKKREMSSRNKLVKQNDPVELRVKEPPVAGRRAGSGTAVEKHRRLQN